MKPIVCYLWVYFGTRLSTKPHINYIASKATKLLSEFMKLARAHSSLNTKTIRIIYKGLFLPILCYAAAE